MDNASKALIMAGAILISIAIVGVGVFIFSSTSNIGETGAAVMDSTSAQMVNSTLSRYASTRQKGSTVKEMIAYINVQNTNNVFPVPVEGSGDDDLAKSYESNKYYTVEFADDNGDGYYDKVDVTQNT